MVLKDFLNESFVELVLSSLEAKNYKIYNCSNLCSVLSFKV